MSKRNCPDCGAEMMPGRRRDKIDNAAISQEAWVKGEPKPEIMGWTSGHGTAVPVVTYACKDCGRLVSYLKRD